MNLEQWLAKLTAAAGTPPSAQPLSDAAKRAAQAASNLTRGRTTFSARSSGKGAVISAPGSSSGRRALRRVLSDEVDQARADIRDEAYGKLR